MKLHRLIPEENYTKEKLLKYYRDAVRVVELTGQGQPNLVLSSAISVEDTIKALYQTTLTTPSS